MSNWENADGLKVQFGPQESLNVGGTNATTKRFEATIDLTDPVGFTADLNNDGTNDGYAEDAFIPAGSFITNAYLIVTTAAADGTSLTLGLYKADGTAIDADGIDAAVATADLAANKAVVCDGDLVRGTATVGAANAYLKATVAGTYTAGEVKLIIEYLEA
jgi:hypothetical protein